MINPLEVSNAIERPVAEAKNVGETITEVRFLNIHKNYIINLQKKMKY